MKKILLVLTLVISCLATVKAQNIAIGARVPDLKVSSWLKNRQPTTAPLTYIEFFHPSNKSGIHSIEQLIKSANKLDTKLQIIIIAKDSDKKTIAILTPYVSDNVVVGIDASGKTFSSFGVDYVPFGVIIDSKERALWMGNSLQITPEFISQIDK